MHLVIITQYNNKIITLHNAQIQKKSNGQNVQTNCKIVKEH